MADGEVGLKFSTTGGDDVVGAYDSFEDALERQAKGVRKNSAEERKLESLRKRIASRNETAAQRKIRLINEAKKALGGEKKNAQLLAAEVNRIEKAYEGTNQEFSKFRDKSKATLSGGGLKLLGVYAAGVVAIKKAWNLARAANEEYAEAAKRGQEGSASATTGVGLLRQLTDDQAIFDDLVKTSGELGVEMGADLDSGARAYFSIVSAQLGQKIELFKNLAGAGILSDVGGTAESTAAVGNAFKAATEPKAAAAQVAMTAAKSGLDAFGNTLQKVADAGFQAGTLTKASTKVSELSDRVKTALAKRQVVDAGSGSAESIIAKGLIAASEGLTSLDAVLKGVAKAGSGASAVTVPDEDVFAAVSAITKVEQDADVASTQIQAFFAAAAKRSLGGAASTPKSIADIMEDIESRNLAAPELFTLLQNKRAFQAYTTLRANRDFYNSVLEKLEDGNARGEEIINKRVNLKDPATDAARLRKKEEAKSATRQKDRGIYADVYDTYRMRRDDELLEKPFGGLRVAVQGWIDAAFTDPRKNVTSRVNSGRINSEDDPDLYASAVKLMKAEIEERARAKRQGKTDADRDAEAQRDTTNDKLDGLRDAIDKQTRQNKPKPLVGVRR